MRRWQDLSEDDYQVCGFNLLRLSQGKEISLSDVLSETPDASQGGISGAEGCVQLNFHLLQNLLSCWWERFHPV